MGIINLFINLKKWNVKCSSAQKHKTSYSNEYYLTNIFEILNDINKWETLKKLKTYNPVVIHN